MSKASCILAFPSKVPVEDIVNSVEQSSEFVDENASMWLWVRGQYDVGSLSLDSFKVASELINKGWIVRNEVAWACKVSDPAPENRLKRSYEKIFFLVRGTNYYFDRTLGLGTKNKLLKNKHGNCITRSGVVGAKYAHQIEQSPFLSNDEKITAMNALQDATRRMESGEISDFRMSIRGLHQVTRSVAEKVDIHGFHVRITKSRSNLLEDLWVSCSSESNSCVPQKILLALLRLSSPMGGLVFDLFPSTRTANIVMESGRQYLAKGIYLSRDEETADQLFNVENFKIGKDI